MRLALRREALADLTSGELSSVHGGAAPESLQIRDCFEPLTHPTALDCITGPITAAPR